MWLTGRLVPDHKRIADFRKDNGRAIRKVCVRFVELCREIGLLTKASVAIDGSKSKAVNNRDRDFTRANVERRRAQPTRRSLMVKVFEDDLNEPQARVCALALIALCVGGMVLARNVGDPGLAAAFHRAAHDEVLTTAGWK